MYRLLAEARVVINRHGSIAGPYAVNMRMYEATGMGALLVTDNGEQLGDVFAPDVEAVSYGSARELVDRLEYYLRNEDERAAIAAAGQTRTLRDHTYRQADATSSSRCWRTRPPDAGPESFRAPATVVADGLGGGQRRGDGGTAEGAFHRSWPMWLVAFSLNGFYLYLAVLDVVDVGADHAARRHVLQPPRRRAARNGGGWHRRG